MKKCAFISGKEIKAQLFLLIELEISILYPADPAAEKAEKPADNSRQNDADEKKAQPVKGCGGYRGSA